MPVSSPLTGARAKVARANEHLAELDTLGSRWAARISYTLRLEVLNTKILVAKMFDLANAEPPIQMALVAGDAVHNLRSALDHVIYQFAVAGGASGERRPAWRAWRRMAMTAALSRDIGVR